MSYKFANAQSVVSWNGLRLRLNPGEVWAADDPFVRANPGLFADVPPVVCSSGSAPVSRVEQATAMPGERRTTRRG
jgi:hypothetical protein